MATVRAIRQSGVLDLALGTDLLDSSSLNKGGAFTQIERGRKRQGCAELQNDRRRLS
jgi:hypothetical protein